MKYEVKSYLKINEEFLDVSEYDGTVKDEDYIEGAIELQIGNKQILTLEHWDLVDQLWAYLLEAAGKIRLGDDYESCFPDQPLQLRLKPIGDYAVELTVGKTSTTVDKATLLEAFSEGAITFFERMANIVPRSKETWSMYEGEAIQLVK